MNSERRILGDRRKRDIGPPPGGGERRRQAERRLPTAEETVLSAAEFARYFGNLTEVPAPAVATRPTAGIARRR